MSSRGALATKDLLAAASCPIGWDNSQRQVGPSSLKLLWTTETDLRELLRLINLIEHAAVIEVLGLRLFPAAELFVDREQ
jgi:hypothetical protein